MIGSEMEKEEAKQLDGSLRDLFKIRRHTINLAILIYMWIASSFNSYLVSYEMKYIPGDIFQNSLISSLSELPFVMLGGFIYHRFGIRIVLTGAFLIALIGSLLIIFIASESTKDFVPYMLTFARDGVKTTFDICYLANSLLFPAIFAGTAFGICNVGAKTATILSPLVAEVKDPIPMIVFASLATVAIVLTQFIRPPSKHDI
jgi:MFS family permease